MACTSCSSGANGMPTGCGSKGHCATGGCNKLNTFDWLTALDLEDPNACDFIELSFKGGARKTFYRGRPNSNYTSGDLVVVDTGSGGYDVGRVSMMGDLVKLQMKRKNFAEDRITYEVLRKANNRDIEKMEEARKLEHPALVKARVISRTLGLDMKIGDVEYQADLRKATFFYTSDGWVDFRELVKGYAKEFRVKIEMRQIGARQESARIGGIGSCGRELCCSTWLTDFKSVNTNAARYQNIAINQSKLTGQCGRLKCCLNYELDMYVDELDKYPANVDYLYAKNGRASLIKIDIFKGMLYYSYEPEKGRTLVMPLSPDEVRRIKSMNEKGEKPLDIVASEEISDVPKVETSEFIDGSGEIELPFEKRKKKKNKNRNRPNDGSDSRPPFQNRDQPTTPRTPSTENKEDSQKDNPNLKPPGSQLRSNNPNQRKKFYKPNRNPNNNPNNNNNNNNQGPPAGN